jgi:pSer/pThr/pTyr-binding forkhead associated (FHA) protein
MPDQVLTIDANDLRHFFFKVEGETLTIGFDPVNSEGTLRNLRIKGIRCELEVADGPVTVRAADASGKKSETVLVADEERHMGSARLCLMPTLAADDEIEEVDGQPRHRLVVVNGADIGRAFVINDAGMTRIGKDSKTSDVTLNDLYVAHVHCQLEDVAGRVFLSHLNGSGGTFVNGQKIGVRTELKLGDVVRVGNSHLKLELDEGKPAAPSAPEPPAEEQEVVDSWSGEEPAYKSKRHAAAAASVAAPPAPPPKPAPAPAAPPRDHKTIDKLAQLENQTFGHFQIGERLGRGQFGAVFRARDVKTNQTVALKILSPDFPKTDAELQSFGRVFKAAPSLRDSHLVPLLGVGRSLPYTWISREYVDGEGLGNLLARYAQEGKVSWKRACRVGAQIGAALDFLHQHKIAHLNLTPKNILIRRDDGSAKLADVLLTQALHGSHLQKETHPHKQQAEAVYLAPEQLAGATGDFRCDLYALGVICYALAMGQPPFVGATVDEVRGEIAAGAIAKPSRLHKDIPPAFEAAMLKLLAADPADRFHEIGEFLDMVEPILMMHDIR